MFVQIRFNVLTVLLLIVRLAHLHRLVQDTGLRAMFVKLKLSCGIGFSVHLTTMVQIVILTVLQLIDLPAIPMGT